MKGISEQKVAREGEGEEWSENGEAAQVHGRTHAQKARATRDATFARRDEWLTVVNNAEVGMEFRNSCTHVARTKDSKVTVVNKGVIYKTHTRG